MGCTYSTALQDRNTLLCHSCEFMLTNVKKAENKFNILLVLVTSSSSNDIIN